MTNTTGIKTQINHNYKLCVAFLVCGLVRILEHGRPTVHSFLQESLERNGYTRIKQTMYRPKIVERFGSELTATPIYRDKTVASLHSFTETELRQTQHINNLQ